MGEAVCGGKGDITGREERGARCGNKARVLVLVVCCAREWDGEQRSVAWDALLSGMIGAYGR